MRFAAAHKLVTYLLVLAALGTLASTGALHLASAMLFLGACALSFWVDAGNRFAVALDRAATLARLATAALFVAIVWRVWQRLPDPDLAPAFDLVLALLVYKLFYRRTHRDYIHILALSFLLVLVASTLAGTFLFLAAFALYVVLGTWALILFHLRREMEENYLVKHSAQAPSQKVGVGRILGSRRVVGRAFFGATAAVAVLVFLGAVAIFIFVPRLGAGFVLGTQPVSENASGFADEVAIGRYGTVAGASREVVLRATVPAITAVEDDEERRRAVEALYFRGAVYDRYDRGRWVRSRQPDLATVVEVDGNRYWIRERAGAGGAGQADPPGDRSLDGTTQQEIETVGLPSSVLFAIDRVVAIDLPALRLGAAGTLRVWPRWSGETALRIGATSENGDGFVPLGRTHHLAYSILPSASPSPSPSPADGPARRALSAAAEGAYLGVPRELVAPLAEMSTAAASWNGFSGADGDPIARLVAWLRAHHGYTNQPPPSAPGVDPVVDFVVRQPAGHCELFASAAVLLMRAHGIPARYVTGFRGGEWNAMAQYIAVRDDRAHAWAEAFLPETGWIRVDPTPAGEAPAPPGRAAQAVDALDYLWNRWVIGYDLGRQRDLARRAGRRLAPLGATAAWRPVGLAKGIVAGLVVAVAGSLAAVGVLAYRRRRLQGRLDGQTSSGRRSPPRAVGAIERLYRKTLSRLARAGWPRHPSETPREYAERLRASNLFDGFGAGFDSLTERYAAARFGGHPVTDAAVAELAAKLASPPPTRSHLGSPPPDIRV